MLKKLTNNKTKRMKRAFVERSAWVDCNHDCMIFCGSYYNELFYVVQVELAW